MKKYILIVTVVVLVSMLSSHTHTSSINSAIVNQEQGLYLFIESKPSGEYTYIGDVSLNVVMNNSYSEVKGSLIKKCKQKYPSANGIIMNISNTSAEAIIVK